MQETSGVFIKRLMGFSLGPVAGAFLGFINTILLTWFLIPMDLGKVSMYTLFSTLLSLGIYLGLDQAFMREYNGSKDKIKLFWTSITLPLIISIITALILLVVYKPASKIFFAEESFILILILGASIPLYIIERYSFLILRMQERSIQYSMLNISNKLNNLVMSFIFLKFVNRSYIGMVGATFTALILNCIFQVLYTREFWFKKVQIDRKVLATLLKYGLPLVPTMLIGWLFNSADRMTMRYLSNFSEIGIYSAAFKIASLMTIVQQSFTTFWVPTSFRWYEEGVSNDRFIKVSRYLTSIILILFAVIILFKNVIILILSADYSEAGKSVGFLLLVPVMYTISETTTIGIAFSKKTKYNLLVSLISFVLNLIGNLILVPKYGALGASISTGLSYIAFFFIRTMISKKIWYDFSIKFYLINTALVILLVFTDLIIKRWQLNLGIFIAIGIYNLKNLREITKILYRVISQK
ncbi:oligosaccharide flippase family protein [Fervidicella metallireducens]|uniref:oligosaccharide flippase family protein n=1 Tax=Fervidicella metallireducens TaxID=655338 RepID=UPI0005532186|nr:oligosaccharide flippase family protein [Fervidicella metallireducens]